MYMPKAYGYTNVASSPQIHLESYYVTSPPPQGYGQYPSSPAYAPYSSPQGHVQYPSPPVTYHYRKSRRWADWPSIVLVTLIWLALVVSCLILLYVTSVGRQKNSSGGSYITADEVASSLALSTLPVLCATILNEVLVERCWRRIECFALGRNPLGRDVPEYDGMTMAKHLRAANFGWYKFLKRLFKGELSLRDLRTFGSWLWLRGGTAIAIASTQLSVSWVPVQSAKGGDMQVPEYTAHMRKYWIFVPPVIHAVAMFGVIVFFWFEAPWALFSDRYNNEGLWDSYVPYLQRLQAGSIATCDEAAKVIEHPERPVSGLAKANRPGVQMVAKLRGVWFGFLMMYVPPLLACLHNTLVHTDKSTILRTGLYRFVFHLVFLAQNIFYVVFLDFVIWNLSLEALCKPSPRSRAEGAKRKKHLNSLGKSAGLLLFGKAVRQRRPLRATLFTWLFWLQACAVRFFTVVYIFAVEVISYSSIKDRIAFYDPRFWLAWVELTALVTAPPLLLWLFWPFQAPICEQDGWRWANVVRSVHAKPWVDQAGWYGVVRERSVVDGSDVYRAEFGMDVLTFNETKGKKLV